MEWLEKAGTLKGGGGEEKEEEEAELWYARGLACLRVDHGRGEDGTRSLLLPHPPTHPPRSHPPTHPLTHLPPKHKELLNDAEEGGGGWTEEIETETYGAKTGLEFIRVVRRRANKHKKAYRKEEEKESLSSSSSSSSGTLPPTFLPHQ